MVIWSIEELTHGGQSAKGSSWNESVVGEKTNLCDGRQSCVVVSGSVFFTTAEMDYLSGG
jgi:hypothetical protein